MEADFDRYYGRDLGELIWVEEWPPSKLWSRIAGLPEDSAFIRVFNHGHTALHELLAQTRDAVVTSAHGYRLQGRPKNYERPGTPDRAERRVDLTNPEHVADIRSFFG